MERIKCLIRNLFLPPPCRRIRPDEEDGVVEIRIFYLRGRHNLKNLAKLTILFLIILLPFTLLLSQDENDNKSEFGRGINLQILGPTMLSLYLQSAINSHNLNWNFGIGIIGDIQLGFNYHFLKDRAQSGGSLYIGIQVSRINEIKLSGFPRTEVNTISIYFPVGLEIIKHNGFTFAIEVGPNFPGEDFSQINTPPKLFALRIGYHSIRQ